MASKFVIPSEIGVISLVIDVLFVPGKKGLITVLLIACARETCLVTLPAITPLAHGLFVAD